MYFYINVFKGKKSTMAKLNGFGSFDDFGIHTALCGSYFHDNDSWYNPSSVNLRRLTIVDDHIDLRHKLFSADSVSPILPYSEITTRGVKESDVIAYINTKLDEGVVYYYQELDQAHAAVKDEFDAKGLSDTKLLRLPEIPHSFFVPVYWEGKLHPDKKENPPVFLQCVEVKNDGIWRLEIVRAYFPSTIFLTCGLRSDGLCYLNAEGAGSIVNTVHNGALSRHVPRYNEYENRFLANIFETWYAVGKTPMDVINAADTPIIIDSLTKILYDLFDKDFGTLSRGLPGYLPKSATTTIYSNAVYLHANSGANDPLTSFELGQWTSGDFETSGSLLYLDQVVVPAAIEITSRREGGRSVKYTVSNIEDDTLFVRGGGFEAFIDPSNNTIIGVRERTERGEIY